MPWDSVACCRNCWDARNPEHPARRDGTTDTAPRFPGDELTAACFYCAGPIYGGVIYVREQVQLKSD
jgi:hypothetical protein